MRKKAENIIAGCSILGFSLIWVGVFIAQFYRNLFILFMILGFAIIASGLIYAGYNQWRERQLGIDVEAQRQERKEVEVEFNAIQQSPLPSLPMISRLYGALILAIPILAVASSVWDWIPTRQSSFSDTIISVLQAPFALLFYGCGYLLLGGKFSTNPEKHKYWFFSLLPIARGFVLFFGYASLFFGLCFASTLYRNASPHFKSLTLVLVVFGLFTAIYFNLRSVKQTFKNPGRL